MGKAHEVREGEPGRVDVVRWVKENAGRLRELRWLYRLSGMPDKRPVKVMNMDEGAEVRGVFLILPKGAYYGLYIELVQEGDAPEMGRFLSSMWDAGFFAASLHPGEAVEALREYCRGREPEREGGVTAWSTRMSSWRGF